ncbi:MAG: hypothetical protein LBU22_11850 [Dysgonamonadaceae bacterium]|jgi:hypothetical protein|nr:hypothetical protein [Dysgonamonadaceae bacterium]
MDLHEFFFLTSPALLKIFEFGFIPTKDDFCELTPTLYQKYYREVGQTNERIFMLLPDDPNFQQPGEMRVVTEKEMLSFDKAKQLIEIYCSESKETFKNEQEKLIFVASVLPPVFSEGTKYQVQGRKKNK